MINLSETLGKQVICLSTAKICGTIENVIFDDKLLAAKTLKVYCDDDFDATTKYISVKQILCMQNDACVIGDDSALKAEWEENICGLVNPINSNCYNQDGIFLGTVRDITLDKSKVAEIKLDNIVVCSKNLLSSSNGILIFNDSGKKIKLKKNAAVIPKSNTSQAVHIHMTTPQTIDIETAETSTSQTTIPPQTKATNSVIEVSNIQSTLNNKMPFLSENSKMLIENETVEIPVKVPEEDTQVSRYATQKNTSATVYDFLLGKTLSRDLYDDSSNIVLNKSLIVDQNAIITARKCGKLVQLALFSD